MVIGCCPLSLLDLVLPFHNFILQTVLSPIDCFLSHFFAFLQLSTNLTKILLFFPFLEQLEILWMFLLGKVNRNRT